MNRRCRDRAAQDTHNLAIPFREKRQKKVLYACDEAEHAIPSREAVALPSETNTPRLGDTGGPVAMIEKLVLFGRGDPAGGRGRRMR
jgi:hypothetical protein